MHAFMEGRIEAECRPLLVSTLFSKAGPVTDSLELIYLVRLAGKQASNSLSPAWSTGFMSVSCHAFCLEAWHLNSSPHATQQEFYP